MVKFVNCLTGTIMWVHESRVEEYKAAGHKLAAEPSKTENVSDVKKPAKKTKK